MVLRIDAPARADLGCVLGPGSRAVLYPDGHVRWIDDLAPQEE